MTLEFTSFCRWGASFLKWLQWIEKNFDKFNVPLMCMHGTADKLTLIDGSRLLVEHVASKDKTLKVRFYVCFILTSIISNQRTL